MAEKEVLLILPRTLVVRTSWFFGPWDEYNFITATLRSQEPRTRTGGGSRRDDTPHYLPDKVNACLDLLIDGESGIWHLANKGRDHGA